MDTHNNNQPDNNPPGQVPNDSSSVDGAGQPGVSDAAVAALAQEIEALRQRLEPLDGLDEQLTGLAHTVTDLATTVAELHQQRRTAPPAGAMSWLDLPDGADGGTPIAVDSVRQVLGDLVVWVERVYLRYPDAARHFPECWLWHPSVVEELTWLRHAWECAYRAEDAAPGLSWDWHDRYRPGVVRRIGEAAGRCSLDNHRTRHTGAAPAACGLGGLDALADWWATARHNAPPAPSAEVIEQAREAEAARLRDGGRR